MRKHGLFERRLLDIAHIGGDVSGVEVYPGGAAVPFEQEGERLTVDMQGMALDPVDTIVRVVFVGE